MALQATYKDINGNTYGIDWDAIGKTVGGKVVDGRIERFNDGCVKAIAHYTLEDGESDYINIAHVRGAFYPVK